MHNESYEDIPTDEFFKLRQKELDERWRVEQQLTECDRWRPEDGYSLDDPKRLGPGGYW